MSTPFWSTNLEGFEGAVYSANPWDVVTIAGEKLPGICRVTAPQSKYKIDSQSVNGIDGGALVLRGYQPGALGVDCTIWTPAQWAKLEAIIKKVWEKPGKIAGDAPSGKSKGGAQDAAAARLAEKRAYDIVHPALQLLGITRVVIESISTPEPGPAPQSMVVSFRLQEFVAAVAKPQAASGRKVAGSQRKMQEPVEAFRLAAATPLNEPVYPPSATDAGPTGPPAKPNRGPF